MVSSACLALGDSLIGVFLRHRGRGRVLEAAAALREGHRDATPESLRDAEVTGKRWEFVPADLRLLKLPLAGLLPLSGIAPRSTGAAPVHRAPGPARAAQPVPDREAPGTVARRPPAQRVGASVGLPPVGSSSPGHPASTSVIAFCSARVTHSSYFFLTATWPATYVQW